MISITRKGNDLCLGGAFIIKTMGYRGVVASSNKQVSGVPISCPVGLGFELLVYFHIGYTDFVRLLPVYIAIALYAAGLYLTYLFPVGRINPTT